MTIVLSGLEDYEYNDNVLVRLNDHLLGKSLVGKVDNLAEMAAPTLPPSSKGPAPLPRMVLFDTSSELGRYRYRPDPANQNFKILSGS